MTERNEKRRRQTDHSKIGGKMKGAEGKVWKFGGTGSTTLSSFSGWQADVNEI